MDSQYDVDFVIITALEEERDAILAHLGPHTKLAPTDQDMRTYFQSDLKAGLPDGTSGEYRVVILCTWQMGLTEAAIAANDAIRRFKPRFVFMVGIAGGVVENDVALGDILIADQVIGYELQKQTSEGNSPRYDVHRTHRRLLGHAQNLIGDAWADSVSTLRPQSGTPVRHIGPIASGNKVIAIEGPITALREGWPKLIGIEMEASGVASAAFGSSAEPGFFMIRGVSDLADSHKDSTEVKTWRKYACNVAAAYTVHFLKSGPVLFRGAEVPPSVQRHMDEITQYTRYALRRIRLTVPGIEEPLRRNEVDLVETQLSIGRSVLIVGDPGTGKSGLAGLLTNRALAARKLVLLVNAAQLTDIRTEAELRDRVNIDQPLVQAIKDLSEHFDILLIIDQLDNTIGMPAVEVLVDLIIDCIALKGVEVVAVSRRREAVASSLLRKLFDAGLEEIECRDLDAKTAELSLVAMGITNPPEDLIKLARNILNLEVIGTMVQSPSTPDFSAITDEASLWNTYLDAMRQREQTGFIDEAVRLAQESLRHHDRLLTLGNELTYHQQRLESWNVIALVDGSIYRFYHEKLQDFIYAWSCCQKNASPSAVIVDIGEHRATGILQWMNKIYTGRNSPFLAGFLQEMFGS